MVLQSEWGIQGGRLVGRSQGYLFISLSFPTLSSYGQERKGFRLTRRPASGRKPVQFMDVSEPIRPAGLTSSI